MKSAVVIGSGFAGLSAACFLARDGVDVTVLEKNDQVGGRARMLEAEGFRFDMGPSWYWMPDVFERFFAQFGTDPSEFYDLVRLNPSYQVLWEDETVSIPANYQALKELFEHYEPGAGKRLDAFLEEAAYKYDAGINKLVYKPGLSVLEFARWDVLSSLFRIDLTGSVYKHVRKYFSHPKLLQLVEFPILFLGALPQNTPALYTLMNHADMKGGTWYPMGGMSRITNGMAQLAERLGVNFQFNEAVKAVQCEKGKITAVETSQNSYDPATIIAACDYHHFEQELLPKDYRTYDEKYWNSRSMAPSCLIYYVGVKGKVDGLIHHNLFFDAPFDVHANALYTTPQWPKNPLMYVCCPSKTDPGVAPAGDENLFILIPVAPGLEDTEAIRKQYFGMVLERLEKRLGVSIRDRIVYQKSYAHRDFCTDYNAFKGNAYGLANTLMQTAFLKPSLKSKRLSNLFYAGQLTVPGPGVPPSLISGELAATQALKTLQPKSVSL